MRRKSERVKPSEKKPEKSRRSKRHSKKKRKSDSSSCEDSAEENETSLKSDSVEKSDDQQESTEDVPESLDKSEADPDSETSGRRSRRTLRKPTTPDVVKTITTPKKEGEPDSVFNFNFLFTTLADLIRNYPILEYENSLNKKQNKKIA